MLDMKASIASFAKQLYAEAETMQSDKIEQSFQETENRDIDIDVDKLSDQDVERMLEQLSAELLAPAGWRLAGFEPAHPLEERILLAQGAPAANLHHDPPLGLSVWPFSILASAKACMQQAFSRAVHVAMAVVPSLGSGRK